MANLQAIHSVGNSLITYLRNSYPEPLRTDHPFEFRLVSSGELAGESALRNVLSLYLYRITQNEYLRNARLANAPSDADAPLSINLHYLLTVWSESAVAEHTVITWAMRELHQHPVLDSSSLSSEAGWDPSDVVHIIPAELATEELMRIWDTLDPAYRLSVSYIARVVRIDRDTVTGGRPVVASRFEFQEAGDRR